MPGCSVFNEEYDMILAHFWGHVTANDMERQVISISSNPQLSDATKEIINFTEVESFDDDIDTENLAKIAEINKKQREKYPEINIAIIAPDAHSFNLAQVYKGHAEMQERKGEIKICMNSDEAISWLGGDKAHWKIMVERVAQMCLL